LGPYLRGSRLGKGSESVALGKIAEWWERRNLKDAASLYNAARFRALTAAEIKASGDLDTPAKSGAVEIDRAIDWLRKAIAAGYENVDQIKTDHDFDILRDHPDFQTLVTELEAKLRM